MRFAESFGLKMSQEGLNSIVPGIYDSEIQRLAEINYILSRTAMLSCSRMYADLASLFNCRLNEPTFVNKGFIANAGDSLATRLQASPDYIAELAVRLTADASRVRLEVEDNGTGIDEAVEPLLFLERIKSYKRVPESERIWNGGAGGHLLSAKRKIDALGGKMWYLNKGQNRGALFWYELPIESIVVRP